LNHTSRKTGRFLEVSNLGDPAGTVLIQADATVQGMTARGRRGWCLAGLLQSLLEELDVRHRDPQLTAQFCDERALDRFSRT
jgi:hypothetical protein